MILILADSTDPWGVALARQLTLRDIPYAIQDPWQMRSSKINRAAWIEGLTGVYRGMNRPYGETLSEAQSLGPREAESDWLAELNALPCPVVNRLSPGGMPSCPTGSPAWEAVVSAHGFQLPDCHAVVNRDEALGCLDPWQGAVYVRPADVAHGGLVLEAEVAKAYTGELAPDRRIFLAQVDPGQLVSLYVVGERVVATVVRSLPRCEVPTPQAGISLSLLQRCSDLVLALGLVHAECLLSLSADGQVTCLDVVASPNYWSCPREAQRQVVGGLIRYLAEDAPSTTLRSVIATGECEAGDRVRVGASEDH